MDSQSSFAAPDSEPNLPPATEPPPIADPIAAPPQKLVAPQKLVVPRRSAPDSRSIARWRWWVALLIVGAFPVVAAFTSTIRTRRSGGGETTLPSSVEGLVFAGALQFAIIMLFWGVSWLFSRATKSELWLGWRTGIAPIWQGALYSIGLRFLPALPLIAVGIVLSLLGYKPQVLADWVNANRPQTEGIGDSVRAGSALYKATMLTFFSFIVAGLGEELWRVATMRGLLEIAPRTFSPLVKNTIAVTVSALVFGVGHLYQGALGVLATAFIGIALGAITLHHRSVWPAVIAHGCFDATSFLMVMLGADKLAPQTHWWFW